MCVMSVCVCLCVFMCVFIFVPVCMCFCVFKCYVCVCCESVRVCLCMSASMCVLSMSFIRLLAGCGGIFFGGGKTLVVWEALWESPIIEKPIRDI